jgi:thiol-disulfide isomerase/thioredoxin
LPSNSSMKTSIFILLFTCTFNSIFSQSFHITLIAPTYKKGTAYLTYYMGNNLNVEDSATVSNKGVAIFKGKRKLLPGVYVMVLPDKKHRLDFLIDKSQTISLKIDTTDLINKSTVTGSKENELYTQYQKFTATKAVLLEKEKAAYTTSSSKSDSVLHENSYAKLNKEINDYRENILKKYPSSMLATLFIAMKEPVLPVQKPQTKSDSIENYVYFKKHFWDGVTFMDNRIIRTPFFIKKLEQYYRNLVILPDSIIKEADYQLLLARNCPEMYQFLLNWLTDEFINPKYMGQDAVFVHLFEKYHSKGLTNWLNKKQLEIISRRAYMLMANLIGEKAANLEMADSLGKPMPLYDVKADYTIVCFWDPTCGHCKEEIPKLDSVFQSSWKKHNVKIYAVLTEDTKTEWVKYTQEHQLIDWVHVYQNKEEAAKETAAQKPSYRQLYDITQTPTLYLLDKDKRIIAKKLSWQQLNELLQIKWK